MVCTPEDGLSMRVTVRDTILQSEKKQCVINFIPSKTIESIFQEISKEFVYNADEIELTLQYKKGDFIYVLNHNKDKTLQEAGIKWTPLDRLTIVVGHLKTKPVALFVPDAADDDLQLGASASPTAADGPPQDAGESMPALTGHYDSYPSSSRSHLKAITVETHNYVGLVNQAMTCYLNSLLQALYMTPEFRNALYNWEFDGQNEARSIPYQLQRLFLNLQTSSKSAVETTDLTYSFGWQNSDAWHQHDIQELCRVMFDALEQKFKDTEQAHLISDLYEGEMLDYVKCLECGTEKSRGDTFLDIPLPVRPFGSTVAYNSVEEALRAFVQPETLDGNNQYRCERCDKKCDAHKGLKFTRFPYLLTLHLKRFDFDYNTMHRIKLNDKVVFPEVLNLNSFTASARRENESPEERDNAVKGDDCSTTDSGSADDVSCQGTDVSSTVNGQEDNCADSDEGIDVSSGTNLHEKEAKGPYIYELFSIMIHSGSASGGHYYAYIKDFDKNLWFCFNDQSVSSIFDDDIRKTYGGGTPRGYYSGAYSSSTNAYMLMYRQIDKNRNRKPIGIEDFPPHIQNLLKEMRRKEEEDRINREKQNDTMNLVVYCWHPQTHALEDTKVAVLMEATLAETARDAHRRFNLGAIVDLADCRMVAYNRKHECIDRSFESDEMRLCDIINNKAGDVDLFTLWMLEIREPGTEWTTYKPGGINMKLYQIHLDTEDIGEPQLVRVDDGDTVGDLKAKVARLLRAHPAEVELVLEMNRNEPKHLDDDRELVRLDENCIAYKLYASTGLDEDRGRGGFAGSRLKRVIERFGYIICLSVVLPNTDVATLESKSIPSLDLNQNQEKLELGSGDRCTNSPSLRVSPQPGTSDGFGDQSNSEDSSLSDSDRTLIGEAPGDCIGMIISNSNSPADHHMASPGDPCEGAYNYDALGHPGGEEMTWDDVVATTASRQADLFFKHTNADSDGEQQNADGSCVRCCRILVDKRMTLERFKKHMELILRVPSEYFKIYRQFTASEEEWSSLSDTLRSAKDYERLTIKLDRVLRKNEIKCGVYHLRPDCADLNNFLFDHVISRGQSVGSAKREILLQAKKLHMLDIPYNKCRLREKGWKKPRLVYFDDQKFDNDIVVSTNMDMYLQELSDTDKVTSKEQLVLFARRWCPSALALRPFHEVVLDGSSVDELKRKLADLSGIPATAIEVAHVKQNMPCELHALEIHGELEWNPKVTSLEQWPVNADDGAVFFYRDKFEPLKELSPEERKSINQAENTRLGRLSAKSYSPGRERALKIYLDTSPGKPGDEYPLD